MRMSYQLISTTVDLGSDKKRLRNRVRISYKKKFTIKWLQSRKVKAIGDTLWIQIVSMPY